MNNENLNSFRESLGKTVTISKDEFVKLCADVSFELIHDDGIDKKSILAMTLLSVAMTGRLTEKLFDEKESEEK